MPEPEFTTPQSPSNPEQPVPPVPESESPQLATPPETITSEPSPTSQSPNSVVSHPSKKKKAKKFLLILLALLLMGGGALAYLKFKPADKTTEQKAADAKKDISSFSYAVITGPLNTFYPAHGTGVDEFVLNEQIFEGLVTYRDRKIVPNLATTWSNSDESTWLFTLKPNVKFHSGRTMTPEDVKFSLDTVKDKELGDLFANTIKNVEIVGSNQIKITTDGPDPILLNKLIFLGIVDSKAAVKDTPINGTGPYTLKPGTTASEKSIDLVAFDDYHGGHVYIRELKFRVYEDDEKTGDALKKGEVNLAAFSTVDAADSIKNSFESLYIDDPTVFALHFNQVKTGPLKNPKVRQAIYQAIDVNEFLKNTKQSGTVATQLVIKDIPGFNNAISRPTVNRDVSKQLLKEAGYPNGFSVSFSYLNSVPILQDVYNEFARQLKEIGIVLKADPYARPANGPSKIGQGQAETFYQGYSSDLLDMSDVYSGVLLEPYYQNSKVSSLMEQANKTFDPAARLSLLKQASQELSNDYAFVPIFSGKAAYLLDKPYIVPVDIPATSYPGVYFWRVYQK